MVEAALVERHVEEGEKLVRALDVVGFPVVAALWRFLPEEEEWRLLIASPKVNELGPLAVYTVIQEVLIEQKIALRLSSISAVRSDEPLVSELRIFAGTDPAPFLGGTYLQKVVIGDKYIEGAYVYRAARIIGTSGTFEVWSAAPDKPRAAKKDWTARPAKVTLEDGFFKKIEVEGFDWPQTQAARGVNAYLGVASNVRQEGGQVFGDVEKWAIVDGRLRSVETVAEEVPLQGYPLTSPAK